MSPGLGCFCCCPLLFCFDEYVDVGDGGPWREEERRLVDDDNGVDDDGGRGSGLLQALAFQSFLFQQFGAPRHRCDGVEICTAALATDHDDDDDDDDSSGGSQELQGGGGHGSSRSSSCART